MSTEWICDTKINELDLIRAVKDHSHLYDKRNLDFFNSQLVDATWAEIGKKFGDNFGWGCQWKWTSLRNKYRDAVRRRRFREVAGMSSAPKWKYEEAMSFLEPHLTESRPKATPTPAEGTIKVPEWRKVSELVALFRGRTVNGTATPRPESKPHFGSELSLDQADSASAYAVPAPVAPTPEPAPAEAKPHEVDPERTTPDLTTDQRTDLIPEASSEDSGFAPEASAGQELEVAVEAEPGSYSSDDLLSGSEESDKKKSTKVKDVITPVVPLPFRFLHPHLTRSFRHRLPAPLRHQAEVTPEKPAPVPTKSKPIPVPARPAPPAVVVPRICQVLNPPVTSRGLTCTVPTPRQPKPVDVVIGALGDILYPGTKTAYKTKMLR